MSAPTQAQFNSSPLGPARNLSRHEQRADDPAGGLGELFNVGADAKASGLATQYEAPTRGAFGQSVLIAAQASGLASARASNR